MIHFLVLLVLAAAQLAPPNRSGVAMGHLHYKVRDVEANKKFWMALGGRPVAAKAGAAEVLKFPDVLVFLSQGESSGGTEGSVVSHVAFRVQSLERIEAAGFKVERLAQFPGVAYIFTPERERIELFDETATNLTFTLDDGGTDPVAMRHNQKLAGPIAAHHIHLYVPEGSELKAKAWYASVFGGVAGKRWRYEAVDFPGINFNFSASPKALPGIRGRMLDHIGFEVSNLAAFCKKLEASGVKFDVPYMKDSSGIGTAFLTDPWGTYIELTEGLKGL
jgi:catechol 2,3-dioxygenase-like lactoylglutathione lyase family enzyme